MLVAAGLAGGRDHALVSLLALNGLRVCPRQSTRISNGWQSNAGIAR